MEKITWHSQIRKIADLNPAPYNPRQLTKKQAEDLGKSLDKFSLAEPIVINLNNTIIGGHQRVTLLKLKGVTEIDVRVPDRELSIEEEQELNLRLNANVGEFDWDALANLDKDLLVEVGFDPKELEYNLEGEGSSQESPEKKKRMVTCPECQHEFEIPKKKRKKNAE